MTPITSSLVRNTLTAPKDVAAAQALAAVAQTGTVEDRAEIAKQLALNSDQFSPEVKAVLQQVLTMPTATAAGAANIGWTADAAPAAAVAPLDLPLEDATVSGTLRYEEPYGGVTAGGDLFYVELPPGSKVNGKAADRVDLRVQGAEQSELNALLGKSVSIVGDLKARKVGGFDFAEERTVVTMRLDNDAVAKLVGHAVRAPFF